MIVNTPVPDVGTPVFDANGYINPVWHQFFFTLLRRTGGTDGIDAQAEQKRTDQNVRDIAYQSALSSSVVPAPPSEATDKGQSQVWDHGVQYDESLHALATQEFDGFMSAEDKMKLDKMTYERGTWTPEISFDAPGDLAVTYASQVGTYVKIGTVVTVSFFLITSSFTYTTASGYLRVKGLPLPNPGPGQSVGALNFEGINRPTYTQFVAGIMPTENFVRVISNASGLVSSLVDTTHVASGGTVALVSTITYYLEETP